MLVVSIVYFEHVNVGWVCKILTNANINLPFQGHKQDVWHAIDPETGVKQHQLTMDGIENMCPPMDKKNSPFYIGRTGRLTLDCRF